ncbi:MAG: AAA family ATPase, partial [Mariprofundaceae bacterium]
MRLKRLELAGFKSFVDPTQIDFGNGITSIVGPNGCGKSNIVDAIRWVLGEHSAKHLRGGVMDDLVFQGSDTRPPVAMCDVELTFAVDRGKLPSPYHELDEIRIRRRLTREGGSDGFINGKMVRIKDIVDLFLDTGISTRAYAIVEQGSIARMITAKPEERRMLFEEAAGVMKYRSRKREAERKMNHTRQNLERITDLLDEVRSQCRSLRQQSSRAERFKQLQDECQKVQSLSFAIRHQQHDETVTKITGELSTAKTNEAQAAQKHSEAESTLAKARNALVLHETEAQQKQDALRTAEQGKAGLQQQAERLSGERKLLAERKAGLNQRIDESNRRIEHLTRDMDVLRQQIASKDDAALLEAKENAAKRLEIANQGNAEAHAKRDQMLAEFERLRSEFENATKRKEQAEQTLIRLNQRQQSVGDQLSDAKNKQVSSKKETEQAVKDADVAKQQFAKAEQKLKQAQQELDQQREKREAAVSQRAECEKHVRELRGEAQELKAQLAQHQKVSDSLRDQIRSQGAVWVDESLQVPEGLELAVAAALRGRAADASLPANTSLSAWRAACEQAKVSPVALFSTNLDSSLACEHNLADAIGIHSEHPLFGLFAHVTLCDDIFEVLAHQGCVVSRDGWRLEGDGWLIPPAQSHTARRLKSQRQLR